MFMKLGVFGSACNPITLGHYDAINEALKYFDKILIVPSFCHPFGKNMIDFEHRCTMVNLFIDDLNLSSKVELSKAEKEIYNGVDPVYTYFLLLHFKKTFSNMDISFICGQDVFDNLSNFTYYKEIINNFKIHNIGERVNIRSSLVRSSINNNEKISHMLSDSVYQYILDNSLY